MGVNFGRLGFLASIGREEIHEVVNSLVSRSYVVDRRTLIHLDASSTLFGDVPYALNEFTIHKKDTSAMVKIHTYLNGEFLNTYWSDGLIVATPTGSTGYSLSCGGPIVFPEAGSFVITPVAPHNLNVRPIVVPDDHVISFEVEGRSDQFICTLDSRMEVIDNRVQLAVKKRRFFLSTCCGSTKAISCTPCVTNCFGASIPGTRGENNYTKAALPGVYTHVGHIRPPGRRM